MPQTLAFSQHRRPLRVRSAAKGRSRTLRGSEIVERQVQEGLLERALLEREDLCSLTACCVAGFQPAPNRFWKAPNENSTLSLFLADEGASLMHDSPEPATVCATAARQRDWQLHQGNSESPGQDCPMIQI